MHGRAMGRWGAARSAALGLALTMGLGALSAAHAEDGERPGDAPGATVEASGSFWSELGASIGYGRADAANYTSEGVATRIRWEPLPYFGIDLTSEFLATEGRGGRAFDIPVGFHLYVPVELGWGVRVRALGGLCVDVSLARSATVSATASDDVRFGFRLGAGTEVALGDRFWAFADAKWERYLGHSRAVSAWSSALDGELGVSDRLAIAIGLGMNL